MLEKISSFFHHSYSKNKTTENKHELAHNIHFFELDIFYFNHFLLTFK